MSGIISDDEKIEALESEKEELQDKLDTIKGYAEEITSLVGKIEDQIS